MGNCVSSENVERDKRNDFLNNRVKTLEGTVETLKNTVEVLQNTVLAEQDRFNDFSNKHTAMAIKQNIRYQHLKRVVECSSPSSKNE